jgi:hypothetical protein
MRTIKLIVLFILIFCLNGFSQTNAPIEFRVEKQAMSTPMSLLEDMFFINYYIAKPVNVKFDGSLLSMYFDNGASFTKKSLTEVDRSAEYENNSLSLETILYTDNANVSDTISLVLDYAVGYVQIILPTKNSKGEYVGYTSYKNFDKNLIKENSIALK